MSLSVVVISFNEEKKIARCLNSVKAIATQMVVLDSGSSDNTCAIAQDCGAQCWQGVPFLGFGPQKNLALSYATEDWVLTLDADEWLSPELAAEIAQVMRSGTSQVYALNRLSSFMGQWIYHGGWHPDFVARLFRRQQAHYSDDLVHEKLVFHSPEQRLKNVLYHESYENIEQLLNKLNRYSTLRAHDLAQAGRSGSLLKALTHGMWTFIRMYFFRAGIADGKAGFLIALSAAESCFWRYIKLSYLPQKKQ